MTGSPVTRPAPSNGATRGEWHDAWVAALDELSLHLDAAESLLRRGEPLAGLPAWAPPVLRHPLPEELADRARAVLDRQLSLSENLVRAMASNRRQDMFMERLDGGTVRERPSFVDQAF